MKKTKIGIIICYILAIGLIVGGIILLVKGSEMTHVDFDFEDFEDMVEDNMSSTGYFAGGSFMLVIGIAALITTTIFAFAKKAATNVENRPLAGSILNFVARGGKKPERYCAYCGSLIEEGQTKCKSCGAAVKQENK